MQTDMHDLSVYSTIWHDNSEALVLESIMKDAGFGGAHQRVVALPGQRNARRAQPQYIYV